MLPEDSRHQSVAGYRAGCRGECCRSAIRRYNEERKLHKISGKPTSQYIDVTGTRRRLQALVALGWSVPQINKHLGMDNPYVRRIMRTNQFVSTRTAARVLAVYAQLSMTLPPMRTRGERQGASRARAYAASRGWPPPLAWDDIDSDPEPIIVNKAKKGQIDEIAVQRFLAGDEVALTRAERRAVLIAWEKAGRSLASLERRSGWNVARMRREVAA